MLEREASPKCPLHSQFQQPPKSPIATPLNKDLVGLNPGRDHVPGARGACPNPFEEESVTWSICCKN